MTSTDVLSMYENLAGLTTEMVDAARSSDWDGLRQLENQCATQARPALAGQAAPLSGAPRLRKIDLLKQIMANDRAIREVTEPWMGQWSQTMQAARQSL